MSVSQNLADPALVRASSPDPLSFPPILGGGRPTRPPRALKWTILLLAEIRPEKQAPTQPPRKAARRGTRNEPEPRPRPPVPVQQFHNLGAGPCLGAAALSCLCRKATRVPRAATSFSSWSKPPPERAYPLPLSLIVVHPVPQFRPCSVRPVLAIYNTQVSCFPNCLGRRGAWQVTYPATDGA